MQTAFIINSRNASGVEKRFSTLFKYISCNKYPNNDHFFFVSRSLFDKAHNFQIKPINNRTKIIKYGLGTNLFAFKIPNIYLIRLVDLILLWFILILYKYKYHFDIIHFVTTSSLKASWLFKNKTRVLSFYNGGTTCESVKHKVFQKVFKDNFLIDCLSSDIQKIILQESGIKETRLFVSPGSFIDLDQTEYDESVKENIITFCGRFTTDKGIPLLLDIIDIFLLHFPYYTIYILGDGPLKDVINSYVNSRRVEDRVIIKYEPTPIPILKKSKIFLSLQRNENYPSQSLLEAMACGNAIIATNVGLTYLLVQRDNGILIENSAQDLISALITLINSQRLVKDFAKESRAIVLKQHRVEIFYEYLMQSYETGLRNE